MRSVIGEGYVKATGQIQPLSTVRVVFKVSRQAGRIYYIVSAYPIP
jgi:hypothetical protein